MIGVFVKSGSPGALTLGESGLQKADFYVFMLYFIYLGLIYFGFGPMLHLSLPSLTSYPNILRRVRLIITSRPSSQIH